MAVVVTIGSACYYNNYEELKKYFNVSAEYDDAVKLGEVCIILGKIVRNNRIIYKSLC